jgi:hypothetical protein
MLGHRSLLSSLVVLGVASSTLTARADTGTLGLTVGGIALEEAGDTTWHPTLRVDLAFNLVGPLEVGGYLTGTATELLFADPAFGGGLLVAVRPTLPILNLTLHLEGTAGREQLPAGMGFATVWATGLGMGLATELVPNVSLELRVNRTFYHGIHQSIPLDDGAWALRAGLGVALP